MSLKAGRLAGLRARCHKLRETRIYKLFNAAENYLQLLDVIENTDGECVKDLNKVDRNIGNMEVKAKQLIESQASAGATAADKRPPAGPSSTETSGAYGSSSAARPPATDTTGLSLSFKTSPYDSQINELRKRATALKEVLIYSVQNLVDTHLKKIDEIADMTVINQTKIINRINNTLFKIENRADVKEWFAKSEVAYKETQQRILPEIYGQTSGEASQVGSGHPEIKEEVIDPGYGPQEMTGQELGYNQQFQDPELWDIMRGLSRGGQEIKEEVIDPGYQQQTQQSAGQTASAAAQTSGAQTSGAQTSGAQTSGAQTSGAQTSGAQTSGLQTLDLDTFLDQLATEYDPTEGAGTEKAWDDLLADLQTIDTSQPEETIEQVMAANEEEDTDWDALAMQQMVGELEAMADAQKEPEARESATEPVQPAVKKPKTTIIEQVLAEEEPPAKWPPREIVLDDNPHIKWWSQMTAPLSDYTKRRYDCLRITSKCHEALEIIFNVFAANKEEENAKDIAEVYRMLIVRMDLINVWRREFRLPSHTSGVVRHYRRLLMENECLQMRTEKTAQDLERIADIRRRRIQYLSTNRTVVAMRLKEKDLIDVINMDTGPHDHDERVRRNNLAAPGFVRKNLAKFTPREMSYYLSQGWLLLRFVRRMRHNPQHINDWPVIRRMASHLRQYLIRLTNEFHVAEDSMLSFESMMLEREPKSDALPRFATITPLMHKPAEPQDLVEATDQWFHVPLEQLELARLEDLAEEFYVATDEEIAQFRHWEARRWQVAGLKRRRDYHEKCLFEFYRLKTGSLGKHGIENFARRVILRVNLLKAWNRCLRLPSYTAKIVRCYRTLLIRYRRLQTKFGIHQRPEDRELLDENLHERLEAIEAALGYGWTEEDFLDVIAMRHYPIEEDRKADLMYIRVDRLVQNYSYLQMKIYHSMGMQYLGEIVGRHNTQTDAETKAVYMRVINYLTTHLNGVYHRMRVIEEEHSAYHEDREPVRPKYPLFKSHLTLNDYTRAEYQEALGPTETDAVAAEPEAEPTTPPAIEEAPNTGAQDWEALRTMQVLPKHVEPLVSKQKGHHPNSVIGSVLFAGLDLELDFLQEIMSTKDVCRTPLAAFPQYPLIVWNLYRKKRTHIPLAIWRPGGQQMADDEEDEVDGEGNTLFMDELKQPMLRLMQSSGGQLAMLRHLLELVVDLNACLLLGTGKLLDVITNLLKVNMLQFYDTNRDFMEYELRRIRRIFRDWCQYYRQNMGKIATTVERLSDSSSDE